MPRSVHRPCVAVTLPNCLRVLVRNKAVMPRQATPRQMEVIRGLCHREVEGWWAESPDVRGWSVVGRSLPEIEELVGTGLEFALGRPVSWTRLETGASA